MPNTFGTEGQSPVNELRHSVAVSDLPKEFGKFGHIPLTHKIVAPSGIWGAVDEFTHEVLKEPNRLDWLVASVEGSGTVTIHGGFSCMDQGKNTGVPLTWWASSGLEELEILSNGPGGAQITNGDGEASSQDITEQCLQSRRRIDGRKLRLVEHHHKHSGRGVKFLSDYKPFVSVVGDDGIFKEIREQRDATHPTNFVIYERKSNIPVVVGITFVTGMRVLVPDGFETGITKELRVPMTPLASITKHGGVRLQEIRSAVSEARTTAPVLVLTVVSTGLALLLAVWIVAKHFSDTVRQRSRELLAMSADAVVSGTGGWGTDEKTLFMVYISAVTILAAPFALAVAEGKIDPRPPIMVSTGATVLYGATKSNLSEDLTNPVAGAPFQVTVYLSVREISKGHFLALGFSSVLIGILASCIILLSARKCSEVTPSHGAPVGGCSAWKSWGTRKLWWIARDREDAKGLTILVEMKKSDISDVDPLRSEDEAKEVPLLVNGAFRAKRNSIVKDDVESAASRNAAGNLAFAQLQSLEPQRYALLARVQLDNKKRYKATLTGSEWYYDRLPRQWEYLRRRFPGCRSIEWYRTHGREFPPDEALALVRIGLLPYMKYVHEVKILQEGHGLAPSGDADDVKAVLCLASSDDTFDGILRDHSVSEGPGYSQPGLSQQFGLAWRRGQISVPWEKKSLQVPYYTKPGNDMGFSDDHVTSDSLGNSSSSYLP